MNERLQNQLATNFERLTTMSNQLDPSKLAPEVEELQQSLLERIIGQDRAIKEIVRAYVPTTVNMHRENRPMGVYLFLGPTGVGKSETVKQFAKSLLNNRNGITKIDCTEFQSDHEVAKLLGAPPGYVGFNVPARLAQDQIDKHQTKTCKINIILFDEIEKADPRLFDAILSIIGDGMLTLGNGNQTDFTKSFIFLTSNLGAKEIKKLLTGEGLGYQKGEVVQAREHLDDDIYRACKVAAEKAFRPEFLNRIDRTIAFRPLSEESIRKILDIELKELQWRIWHSPFRNFQPGDKVPERLTLVFKLTPAAMDFIVKEGFSDLYGARELNRVLDRHLAFPLASLISSKQLGHGDRIKVDYDSEKKDLSFTKDGSLTIN
jgi:ATP-dependent Clp protease ATP-binding subunit ClpA